MTSENEKFDIILQVDLSKLTIYTMENDGGSLFASKVDSQLVDAQRQVRRAMSDLSKAVIGPVSDSGMARWGHVPEGFQIQRPS